MEEQEPFPAKCSTDELPQLEANDGAIADDLQASSIQQLEELLEIKEEEGCISSSAPPPFKIGFILPKSEDYTSLPWSVIFRLSEGYITINGHEESCGSSFSDLDSSVMAGIDICGLEFAMNSVSISENLGRRLRPSAFGVCCGCERGGGEAVEGMEVEESVRCNFDGDWDKMDEDLARFIWDVDDYDASGCMQSCELYS